MKIVGTRRKDGLVASVAACLYVGGVITISMVLHSKDCWVIRMNGPSRKSPAKRMSGNGEVP